MKAKILGLAAAGLMLASTAALSATLIGSLVTIQYDDQTPPPLAVTVTDVLVTDGEEVSCPSNSAFCEELILFDGESIDIRETSIVIKLLAGSTFLPAEPDQFLGFRFLGLNFGDDTKISGVSAFSTNLDGFDDTTAATFSGSDVSVRLASVAVSGESEYGLATIVIETRTTVPEPIPEPSTVVLLGAGLLGLLALRRRTSARAA